jgi:predicted phage terminase large subunit-like protein
LAVAAPAGNPTEIQRLARIRLAREHFLPFVAWTNPDYKAELVHKVIAHRLEQFVKDCEDKKSPRLILKMPPQHGKSELSSRRLPGWILGRNPKWRVGLMSYGASWAARLARDARDVVVSEPYAEVFPGLTLDPSSTAVDDWALVRKVGGGGMVAVGRDGAITGRSLEVLIVDDPVKNQIDADSDNERDATWSNWPGFRNRIQKGGGILVVATQWHHDDLIGRIVQLGKDNPEAKPFEVLNFEAIAPEDDPLGRAVGEPLAPNLHDLPDLLALKNDMPERDWQALYCGRPSNAEGAIFKDEWLVFEDDRNQPGIVVLAGDTAYSQKKTAAYTVIEVWRVEKNCYRLLHVYRDRPDYPSLRENVINLFSAWGAIALVIEDESSGKSLLQELRKESRLPIIGFSPKNMGDKVNRAYAVTPMFSGGKVRLPKAAPWLTAWLNEHREFPVGAYKDQVDTTAMFLLWAQMQRWQPQITEPVTHSFTWDSSAKKRPHMLSRGA